MDELTKSIDSLIDEMFAEPVEKSNMIKDQKPQKETADEAVRAAPKAEKDEARDAGRPKQIADVPQNDTDGARSGEYDSKITEKESDATAKKKEDSQVQVPEQMKKSDEVKTDKVEMTAEEYAEYKELKKAKKAARKEEELRKSQQAQTDLIKSAVADALAAKNAETEALRKSLDETNALVKSMANKPQKSKAVTQVQAVEKFQKSEGSNSLSKAEVLDVAEELVKSKNPDFTMEHAIELENTGYIYDQTARRMLETAVKRRGN